MNELLLLATLLATLVAPAYTHPDKTVYSPDRGRHLGWYKKKESKKDAASSTEDRSWRILWIGGYRQPNVWYVEELKKMERDRSEKERALRKKEEDQARRDKEKARLEESRRKLEKERKERDDKAKKEREKKESDRRKSCLHDTTGPR